MASGDDRVGEAPRTAAGGEAPDVIPSICYGDVAAAIDSLERAFGFERHQVYDGDGGAVLRFGSGWVGLSAEREPGSDRFKHFPVQSPRQAGTLMGGFYVIVDDPDALHERARSAGAEIVMELTDQDYGSREFTARDLEGHLWCFGTYRPPAG